MRLVLFLLRLRNMIVSFFYQKKILRKITLEGEGFLTARSTNIILMDGSSKLDIIIKNHVTLLGKISSQTNGKVYLGNYTRLGKNSTIRSVNSVHIGDYTAIADNVVISDNNNHPVDSDFRRKMKLDKQDGNLRLWKHSENKAILIGSNVWIGENSRINKGVIIGDNSIVAAGSIVTHNIPENTIYGGIPAKFIKKI